MRIFPRVDIIVFRTAGMIMALYAGIFYRDRAVEILKVYFPIKSVVSTILKMPQDPVCQAAGHWDLHST